MEVNEIIEQCNELLEDETYYLQTIELTKDEIKVLLDEIERLNNIINEVIEFCNFGIKEYITDDGFIEEVLQDVLNILKRNKK